MLALYNVFLMFLLPAIRLAAFFNPKLRRGLEGRKNLLRETKEHYLRVSAQPRILIHVASFGELEQAKPVIRALKERFRAAHIHLTFFSPSGYENAIGKYSDVDFITYAPLDRKKDVTDFLDLVKPSIALFVKYDLWPNMASALSQRNIPSLLFAATASESSGRMLPVVRQLYTNVFRGLTRILTISTDDKDRFIGIGVDPSKVIVAGDTRFDQVLARKDALDELRESMLPAHMIEQIRAKGTLVLTIGSSWESDEEIYLPTLKSSVERKDNILTIIAPHEPAEEHVRTLLSQFPNRSIRYSMLPGWTGEPIVIVDSIGKLFGLYGLADIAMIGGGFGAGLHNILEAAVWNLPAIVGPNHNKSREVGQLIDRLAAFEVKDQKEFEFVFWRLVQSEDLRKSAGEHAVQFVIQNEGATSKIMQEIVPFLHNALRKA
jgi:3-deoxy-D-manno-octulosonic-acid transferase